MNSYLKAGFFSLIMIAAIVALLALIHPAEAQRDLSYELTGHVGAGGTAVSGNYQADVAIGQAAAGRQSAGQYELGSGFWGGGTITRGALLRYIFLPLLQGK